MSGLHRIRVLGKELQVRSSAPPERVRKVEEYVNQKLEEIRRSVKSGDFQTITIIALMTLAEEALSPREMGSSPAEAVERLQRLVERIDQVL